MIPQKLHCIVGFSRGLTKHFHVSTYIDEALDPTCKFRASDLGSLRLFCFPKAKYIMYESSEV
jgi:hypothetical protein